MLSLTQHLDGFRKSQQIRICILFLQKLAQINLERKRIEMEFSNYTMQSVYFCNLKRELGCILTCVGVIGEEETYPLQKLGEENIFVFLDTFAIDERYGKICPIF